VFGFLLIPDFSLLALSSALEPLRAANRHRGEELYRWHLLSAGTEIVTASSGVDIHCARAADLDGPLDTLLVIGGMGCPEQDAATSDWLRRLSRHGTRMGAVSSGVYLLARAGLLHGTRCTMHWQYINAFAEEFPDLQVTDELFEIDRDRLTCAGGEAAFDMMLALIGQDHGPQLANAVAENFIHGPMRNPQDQQRMRLRMRLGVAHSKLLEIVETMEGNVEAPLSPPELAEQVGLSLRQMERLFSEYFGRTPTQYYLEIRLHHARTLLQQTTMSILDVAVASGFVSASHFSKCYRTLFGRTPTQEKRANRPRQPEAESNGARPV
jgi:transcriptional regulator GlxA family with amidase domain